MGDYAQARLVADLLIILAVGLAAGVACKRLGLSLMIGYMLAGAVIGDGGLGIVDSESSNLEAVARTGALLLLFAVGIEFSLEELMSLGRYFLIGGPIQMLLAAAPITGVAVAMGLQWQAALLIGAAGALSSTVLVFKSLVELGKLQVPAGRGAVAILLFQDVALVPLILLTPMLSGKGEPPTAAHFAIMAGNATLFLASFVVVRWLLSRWAIRLIAELRSPELVCLFTVVMLGGACLTADQLNLPAALGALAAGVAFSGTRLSKQIDSIVLPFRETFAAVFFVTLGALLRPAVFLEEPALMTLGLVGLIVVKGLAAMIALRVAGLSWPSSFGMGIGLAQLGEFSFLLLLEGHESGVVTREDYHRSMFVALGTLVLTPMLLRFGSKFVRSDEQASTGTLHLPDHGESVNRVLVVGAGPIGRDVALYLETSGWRVTIADLSPVNLHRFAQQGIETIVGDARDRETLDHAHIEAMRLAIVCLPSDDISTEVTAAIRKANSKCAVVCRCRYLGNVAAARKAGAAEVISEEAEAARAILNSARRVVDAN